MMTIAFGRTINLGKLLPIKSNKLNVVIIITGSHSSIVFPYTDLTDTASPGNIPIVIEKHKTIDNPKTQNFLNVENIPTSSLDSSISDSS
jgi:hypothetical protein